MLTFVRFYYAYLSEFSAGTPPPRHFRIEDSFGSDTSPAPISIQVNKPLDLLSINEVMMMVLKNTYLRHILTGNATELKKVLHKRRIFVNVVIQCLYLKKNNTYNVKNYSSRAFFLIKTLG